MPCGHALDEYEILMADAAYQELRCMTCDWIVREGPPEVQYSGPEKEDPWRRPRAEARGEAKGRGGRAKARGGSTRKARERAAAEGWRKAAATAPKKAAKKRRRSR